MDTIQNQFHPLSLFLVKMGQVLTTPEGLGAFGFFFKHLPRFFFVEIENNVELKIMLYPPGFFFWEVGQI